MDKIYFPIFGSGLGHVTRIYGLAKYLREEGDEFRYSTFDEAFEFLEERGEKVQLCPSVDLKWNESGGFSSGSSIVRFPLLMHAFSKQIEFEKNNISDFDPDIVVCDSRLSAVFAARLKSTPVVTILNQFKILFPPRFRGGLGSRLLERISGNMLGLFWSLSDEILMPDLPPPYTISEANVTGSDVANRVRYVGFMSPKTIVSEDRIWKARASLELGNRPLVLIQISGPRATKTRLTEVAMESADQISKDCNVVISLGQPNGSIEPRKFANNSWLYEWCPIKDELFVLSDVIVARAGHTTISQCVDLGKPAVYVPISNHSEQIWNAEKCQKLGIGVELKSEDLSAKNLIGAVEGCLNDSRYAENVQKLKSVSDRYNGTQTAARIIRSYL
ncbi:MAG: glycosyltransferase [Nitrososphaerales archaeon]